MIVDFSTYGINQTRLSHEIVNWNIKESLNLSCVQIHRDDMICSRRFNQARHEPCCNRRSRLVLLVLSSIWEARYDCKIGSVIQQRRRCNATMLATKFNNVGDAMQ